ncbi:FHA domain-containing protein [Pseudomonadota bacterium]
MEEVIFAEILDRHHRIRERVRLERFPATIGAAYNNDVILDDRYVSAQEASIELNELSEPVLCDSGSVNGIVNRNKRKKVEREPLASGDVFRFGHTDVRIMFASHEVPKPIEIKAGILGVSEWGNNKLLLLTVFLLGFIGLIIDEYSGQVGSFSMGEFYETVIGSGFALLLISGVWAAGSRLVSHEFRLLQHVAVLSVIMFAAIVVDTVTGYIDFIFSPDAYLDGTTVFLYCVLGVIWLFTHLCVVSRQAIRIKFATSFVLVGIVFGMVQLGNSLNEDINTGTLSFANTIKAHGHGFIAFSTVDELFEEAHTLKEQLILDVQGEL